MKNPLNKLRPREFRKDFGKYLVIFLLLVITIGFVSGFLVADGSMIKAYNEGVEMCIRDSLIVLVSPMLAIVSGIISRFFLK